MEKSQRPFLRLKKIMIYALIIYLLLIAGFYYFQHLFFFHPRLLPADYQFNFRQKFVEKQIKPNASSVTDIIKFLTADYAKGVVLYFHGNRDNVERYASYSEIFTRHGYECWMVDYPGFGKSTGPLTAENMKLQAMQVYLLARSEFRNKPIIVYGKSMGTGPAAYLASTQACARLILETPYYSLSSVAAHFAPILPIQWLIKVDFSNSAYLKEVTVPVIIFHGTNDKTIPYSNAARLKAVLKKADRFITIEGGKHNGLAESTQYIQVVDSLLQPE